MKYKPNKQELSCAVCGADTPEDINGTPICFDCICQMQDDDDDIKLKVEQSKFDSMDKTISGIIKKVQEYSGIKDLTIKTRKREIVEVRQIAQYIAKKLKCGSLAYISWNTGRKDHATVLNSVKKVSNFRETDKIFKEKYGGLFEYYGI